MYKVVVVDDEVWVRKGIIEAVNWEKLDLECIGEAADGDEAFSMVQAGHPDIVIMDMRMPGMDGIELMKTISGNDPNIIIIIVSGYADFEYAKEAVRNRVFDYLLKPINTQELNDILSKAAIEAAHRKSIAEQNLQQGILATSREDILRNLLLYGSEHTPFESSAQELVETDILDILHAEQYCAAVCRPDYPDENSENPIFSLERAADEFVSHYCRNGLSFIRCGKKEMVMLMYGNWLDYTSILEIISKFSRLYRVSYQLSVSIGIGSISKDYLNLNISYSEASKALRNKEVTSRAQVMLFDAQPAPGVKPYMSEVENRLLYLLQRADKEHACMAFDESMELFRKQSAKVSELQGWLQGLSVSIDKILQQFSADMENVYGKSIREVQDTITRNVFDYDAARQLFHSIIDTCVDFAAADRVHDGYKAIAAIVEDMKQNYFKPLLLGDYAAFYGMNPDYLSRLFKKEIGINFVEYLLDIRILQAKRLLRESRFKFHEIAAMVGYNDYRYFSQVFKKSVGMTAGRYRVE
jgi:two-component system, response regulator YesN